MLDWRSKGEVSAETAVMAAVLGSLVFVVVGVASYWSAAHVATVSAIQGAEVAAVMRSHDTMFERGADRVEQVVTELGSRLSSPPSVVTDGRNVVVKVSVEIPPLLGILPVSVQRQAVVALERFVREWDR